MIGTKEITMVNTARKIVKKYRDNLSLFENADNFYVRLIFEDDGSGIKAYEYTVNSDNWLDYLENSDLGDLKIKAVRIELK